MYNLAIASLLIGILCAFDLSLSYGNDTANVIRDRQIHWPLLYSIKTTSVG